jgi:hypothetical protein
VEALEILAEALRRQDRPVEAEPHERRARAIRDRLQEGDAGPLVAAMIPEALDAEHGIRPHPKRPAIENADQKPRG